jgi:type III secretion protein D
VIGAGEDADVVLVDPGIEAQHAALALTDSGWVLTALEGGLRSADSNRAQTEIELAPGDFARLGDVWLTVVDQDASWENPPPAPADEATDEAAAEPVAEALAEEALAEEAQEEEAADPIAETAADAAEADPSRAGMPDYMSPEFDAPAQPVAAEQEKSEAAPRRGWRELLGRRVVYVPLAATVLSAAAAYAITSKPESALSAKKLAEQSQSRPKSANRPGDRTIAAAFDAMNRDGAGAERPLTPDQLRKAFRKRLADADLLKRFDLTLLDNQWTMQAALDDEEAARFERILTGFIKQHNITFPVHAKVGSSEAMLPFKIRQVISGANASVVTQDGDRLYVGDEYRGVRLVAIEHDQLVFAGKRKIEVKW